MLMIQCVRMTYLQIATSKANQTIRFETQIIFL